MMAFVLALLFSFQQPREAVLVDLDPTTASLASAVGSNGDVSVVAFVELNALGGEEVYVLVSDGRGVEWGNPIRVDLDLTGAAKKMLQGSVVVEDGSAHVFWVDQRNGNAELYSVHSADGGFTWTAEARVNKGLPVGQGEIVSWDVAAASPISGGWNQVYVVMLVSQLNGKRAVFFTQSSDGGQNFGSAIHLPSAYNPGDFDAASVSVDAHGDNQAVYATWLDNRNGSDDVYFQSSSDGGLTWLPSARRMNPVAGTAADMVSLSSARLKLQVGWLDDSQGAGRQLLVDRSSDGGATWLPMPEKVGTYQAGLDDVTNLRCLRNRELPVVVWTDNRSGIEECYVGVWNLTSLQWTEFPLSQGGAQNPLLIGHRAYMAVVWSDLQTPSHLHAMVSRDQGVTWNNLPFDPTTTSGVESASRIAHNKLYGNFVMSWSADDGGVDHIYAGGFRGNELLPVGTFQQGSSIAFVVKGFPLDEIGWPFRILIAGNTGLASLPAADGRSLGLAVDSFFLRTSALLGPASLEGVIASHGGGSTPTMLLPPGLALGTTLFMTAVSLDPAGGFGHTTEVVQRIVLP